MKKIFLTLCVTLVFTAFIYPQVVFDSVTVSDQVGGTKVLVFGLDPTATDGIDLSLGEGLLPPFPPAGAFEARFFLPENNFSGTAASWRDFRNVVSLPYSGEREFRLAYQAGTGSPGIRISWNFPDYLSGILQDLFGGVLINVPISGTGFYDVNPPLDRLKLLVTYDAVLTVELTSFSASVIGSTVVLNWQTASEINNRGFEIERKSLNTNWENIGFVDGIGNSTASSSYSFIDENVSGTSYNYRLKQIDFDGTFSYSKEVEVDLTVTDFILHQNYPNPFNPSTEISFSVPNTSNVTITIFNILGSEVRTLFSGQVQAGTYKAVWDGLNNAGSQMSSGSYIYMMSAGEFIQSKKMILIK